MRQKIVRLVLVGGVLVLALLLLLATCGSGEKAADKPKKQAKKSETEVTQLTVPSAYATERGWELIGTSPDYAVSRTTGRLAYLVRESETKYQLRTIDSKTGRAAGTARAGGPRRRTSSRGSSRSPSTTTSTS